MKSVYKKIKAKRLLHKMQGMVYDAYIETSKDAGDKLLKDLKKLMTVTWDDQRTKVLDLVINYILDLSTPSFTATDLEYINNLLSDELGVKLTSLQEDSILQINEKILKLGITEVGNSLDLKLAFDIADLKASEILGKQNLFWVGNYYNKNLKSDIDDTLRGYFLEGETIDDVAQSFETKFTKLTDKGDYYFEGLAKHTTQTVRNLGKITGYEKAGVKGYRIVAVIDDRTSEICEEMNGKEFLLQRGIDYRDKMLSVGSPEDVKQVSEWLPLEEIQGLEADDLPFSMSLPPFHYGGCRTTTEAIF